MRRPGAAKWHQSAVCLLSAAFPVIHLSTFEHANKLHSKDKLSCSEPHKNIVEQISGKFSFGLSTTKIVIP